MTLQLKKKNAILYLALFSPVTKNKNKTERRREERECAGMEERMVKREHSKKGGRMHGMWPTEDYCLLHVVTSATQPNCPTMTHLHLDHSILHQPSNRPSLTVMFVCL